MYGIGSEGGGPSCSNNTSFFVTSSDFRQCRKRCGTQRPMIGLSYRHDGCNLSLLVISLIPYLLESLLIFWCHVNGEIFGSSSLVDFLSHEYRCPPLAKIAVTATNDLVATVVNDPTRNVENLLVISIIEHDKVSTIVQTFKSHDSPIHANETILHLSAVRNAHHNDIRCFEVGSHLLPRSITHRVIVLLAGYPNG